MLFEICCVPLQERVGLHEDYAIASQHDDFDRHFRNFVKYDNLFTPCSYVFYLINCEHTTFKWIPTSCWYVEIVKCVWMDFKMYIYKGISSLIYILGLYVLFWQDSSDSFQLCINFHNLSFQASVTVCGQPMWCFWWMAHPALDATTSSWWRGSWQAWWSHLPELWAGQVYALESCNTVTPPGGRMTPNCMLIGLL